MAPEETTDTRGAEIATVLALPVAILSLGAAVIATVVALQAGAVESDTLLSAAWQLAGAATATAGRCLLERAGWRGDL